MKARSSLRFAAIPAVVVAVAILAGCGSGSVGVEPAITQSNPLKTSKLQFAVGTMTVNESSQSKVYTFLNVVETLRQPNGLSAVLDSDPIITGPPGFVGQPNPNPSATPGPTRILSGSGPGIPCSKTQFGCTGGAFGYGIAPDNTVPTQQAPSFAQYFQPMSVAGETNVLQVPYYGGPPVFPPFNNGTFPAGFLGYPAGFLGFQSAPVLGIYKFDVTIPTGPGTFGTLSTSAMLASLNPLPALQAPSAFPDPDPNNPNGLKIDITVPAGVVETWVWIQDAGACYPKTQGNALNNQYYTVLTTQTGAQQLTLPGNLGPTNGQGTTPTICDSQQNQQATGNPNAPGDTYTVYAAGFDYPALAPAYPFNLNPAPPLGDAQGQVNVTVTEPVSFVYP